MNSITISIVSHGHNIMINDLLNDIVACKNIDRIILTQNIVENEIKIPTLLNNKIRIIKNKKPIGFGENHNNAFKLCTSEWFVILNPDVRLYNDPFISLINSTESDKNLLAPIVINADGLIEDNVREFPTFVGLIKRILRISDGRVIINCNKLQKVDWVAGMFMLFPSSLFRNINGFDQKFYLYCEDVDICARVWEYGGMVLCNPSVKVIHDGQRLSKKNLYYFIIHCKSMIRYFLKYNKLLYYFYSNSK